MFQRLFGLLERRGWQRRRWANVASLLDALNADQPVRDTYSPTVAEHVVWSGGEQCDSSS